MQDEDDENGSVAVKEEEESDASTPGTPVRINLSFAFGAVTDCLQNGDDENEKASVAEGQDEDNAIIILDDEVRIKVSSSCWGVADSL